MKQPATTIDSPVPPIQDTLIEFGPFRFDPANGLLSRDNCEIPLPPRALGVLALLFRNRGRMVSKQELLDTVWKDVTVEEASLKEAVSFLRQTLGDDPKQPKYIQTIHRRGYRFVAATSLAGNPAFPAITTLPSKEWKSRLTARGMVIGLLAGIMLGVFGAWLWIPSDQVEPGTVARFTVMPSAGETLDDSDTPMVAITTDGSVFAYVSRRGDTSNLYIRALDKPDAKLIPGSEGAQAPFFSPNGKWIGFCADGMLKIAPLDGGTTANLTPVTDCAGASWAQNDRIVYGRDSGLWTIAVHGGTPAPLTHINADAGESGHWWPQVTRDGSVLFTIWKTVLNNAEVAMLKPGASSYRIITTGASNPHYLQSGHLIMLRESGPVQVPFDLSSGQVTDAPVAIGADVLMNIFTGVVQLAVANNGTQVMVTGRALPSAASIVWVDQSGNKVATRLPSRAYRNARLSRDGKYVAVTISDPESYDIWIGDLAHGYLTRLTTTGRNTDPVWSPDGKWVSYASSVNGALLQQRVDGTGKPKTLTVGSEPRYPTSYSPDGRLLAFGVMRADNTEDIQVMQLNATESSKVFPHAAGNVPDAQFSPDGHWLAYVTDASGRFPGDNQIFVCRFPVTGPVVRVSGGSGENPVWAPDAKSIYYQDAHSVIRVPVRLSGTAAPLIGKPQRLFETADMMLRGVSPDGKRLLMIDSGSRDKSPNRIMVEVH